jgi:hypothetical protein
MRASAQLAGIAGTQISVGVCHLSWFDEFIGPWHSIWSNHYRDRAIEFDFDPECRKYYLFHVTGDPVVLQELAKRWVNDSQFAFSLPTGEVLAALYQQVLPTRFKVRPRKRMDILRDGYMASDVLERDAVTTHCLFGAGYDKVYYVRTAQVGHAYQLVRGWTTRSPLHGEYAWQLGSERKRLITLPGSSTVAPEPEN